MFLSPLLTCSHVAHTEVTTTKIEKKKTKIITNKNEQPHNINLVCIFSAVDGCRCVELVLPLPMAAVLLNQLPHELEKEARGGGNEVER